MDLPAEWEITPLSDVCQFKPPKSIPRKELAPDAHVSFVPMNDLGESSKDFTATGSRTLESVIKGYTYFADGDVICAKITPCFENGKLGVAQGLSSGVGFGSSEFVVMRTGPKLDAEYLYYFLARDEFREAGQRVMSGAVGHKRVPKEYFETLPIPLPPLEEQRRIVAKLDQAFTALDLARAHAEANLADAGELFDGAVKVALEKLVADHGLSELGEFADFRNGFAFKSKKFRATGEPVVRISNIQDGEVDLSSAVFSVQDDYSEDLSRYVVGLDELLIAMSGATTGKIGFNRTGKTMYQNQRVGRFRETHSLSLEYLAYVLQTKVEEHLSISAGAAQPNLSTKQITEIKMPIPAVSIQKEVVRKLGEFRELSNALSLKYKQSITDIADLRQSLLQQAFSGQL